MDSVFPACAGVIPVDDFASLYGLGFPRMRGGDPNESNGWELVDLFSPHARG